MIAKRLLVAFALAAVLAAGWQSSQETAAQEPAPIVLDPPATPSGSVIPATVPPSSEAPGTSPPAVDPATVPTSEAPALTPSTTPIAPPAADPTAIPAGSLPPSTTLPVADTPTLPPSTTPIPSAAPPAADVPSLPPSTTPLDVPVLDTGIAPSSAVLEAPTIETTPFVPSTDPSALPVAADPTALLPTSPLPSGPVPSASLPPSSTPTLDAAPSAADAPSLPPSTTPLNVPVLDPGIAPPSTTPDLVPGEAAPILPQLNPLTVPPGTDPAALPPTMPTTDPAPSAGTSSDDPFDAPPSTGSADPFGPTPGSTDPFGPSSAPSLADPFAQAPNSVDPFGQAPGAADPFGPSATTPPATSQNAEAPKLSAKFLLLETDWEKSNDRDEALELAGALTSGVFELSKPQTTIFRRGHASILSGDGARRLVRDMQSLGLVRLAGDAQDLNAQEGGGVRTLAAIAATIPVKGSDGQSTPQGWTFLVVAEPYPDLSAIAVAVPITPPLPGMQVSIVGWRDASESASSGADPAAATVPTPNDRYAGSFILRRDQSALVPLHLPGIDGLTVLVAPQVDGPSVQSLGPGLPAGQVQPLHTNSGLDWNTVIGAFESSSFGKAIPTIGPPVGAASDSTLGAPQERNVEFEIYVSPVDEKEANRLLEASSGWDFVSERNWAPPRAGEVGQLRGGVTASAISGPRIRDLVTQTLPGKTVQIARRSLAAELTLTWSPAAEAQFEEVEQALQALQSSQAASVLSKQLQGDRGEMTVSVEFPVRQTVVELVKAALPGATVRDSGPQNMQGLSIVWLQHANAAEIANDFQSLVPGKGNSAVADERTNALIVTGKQLNSGSGRSALLNRLRELDRPETYADGSSRSSGDSTGAPPTKDGYTISIRFVSEEDVKRVVQALADSDLSVDLLSRQLQANGLAAIETRAPADSEDKLYDLVKKLLPNATVQIGIERSSPPAASTSNRVRNFLSWSPAQEGQIERVEEALKRSDLDIGVISVQFQGDRALMEVETDADSWQAVLDLVKKAVPEATVRDEGVERAVAEEQPEDGETVVVRLEYANAADAAKIIESLKRDKDIRIAVDERTNSLFFSAPQETQYRHIEEALELLKRLDTPEETPKVAGRDLAFPVDRVANAADLRKSLERIEDQVKSAADEASSLSGAERDGKIRSLRELVTQAFRLRLDLQREEAAELRDRLTKIETNLKRRERVEGAVVDRRIEILLDPALEWPDLSLDEATPTDSSSMPLSAPPAASASATSSDAALQFLQQSPNQLASGDSFSAASTLAMGIARLNDELQTLTRDGAPPDSEVRLALLQRQLDLLRQEFDARHQALQQELQAAKSKLRVAQTSWERISAMRDTGSVSAEEGDKAQAELETAQAELARQEILLQQYDRAKNAMAEPTVPAGASEPAPSAAANASLPIAGPRTTDPPPQELFGSWRLEKRNVMNEPDAEFPPPALQWAFNAAGFISWEGTAAVQGVNYGIENLSPGEFRTFRNVQNGVQQTVERGHRYRYELKGDSLRVVRSSDTDDADPRPIAPAADVIYYEFTRKPPLAQPIQANGSVPADLQGVWKVVRNVSNGQEWPPKEGEGAWDADESDWRFYGEYAFYRHKDNSQDNATIYRVVVDTSSTPHRMELHPIAMPFEDYAHIANLKPTHYLYEVEGDRLRMAIRDWRGRPQEAYPKELAPGDGVDYLELDRVAAADAIVPVDDGVPGGDRESWTRRGPFGVDDPSQRKDDQFAIATSLALRLAELSRRIKTLEAQPEESRDPGELDSARSSFDLLRQEFDARENAAKRAFATSAEDVAIAEARLQAAKKLHDAGQSTGWDYSNAQTAAYEAKEQAKFQEALIGHYDRARKTFESSPIGPAAASAGTSVAPPELQGRWRVTRRTVLDDAPELQVRTTAWTFAGEELTVEREGLADVSYIPVFQPDLPGEFRSYRILAGPQGREIVDPVFAYRYELDGDLLTVIQGPGDGKTLPKSVSGGIPNDQGLTFLEFARVKDATASAAAETEVPSDPQSAELLKRLQGDWKTVRHWSGQQRQSRGPNFRFQGTTLVMESGDTASWTYTIEPTGPDSLMMTVLESDPRNRRIPVRLAFVGDELRLVRPAPTNGALPDKVEPSLDMLYYALVRSDAETAPQADANDASASPQAASNSPPEIPAALKGRWQLFQRSNGTEELDAIPIREAKIWAFEDGLLRAFGTERGLPVPEAVYELTFDPSSPDEFERRLLGSADGPSAEPGRRVRFELRGNELHLVERTEPDATLPDQVGPAEGTDYYAFRKLPLNRRQEQLVVPSGEQALVAPELQGTWRLTTENGPDGSREPETPTTWTFDADGLTIPKQAGGATRYAIEFGPEASGQFQTVRVVTASWGPVAAERDFSGTYRLDGGQLQVSVRPKALGWPAGGNELTHLAFERVEEGDASALEVPSSSNDSTAPTPEKASESAAPKELLGVWRMKSYEAADQPNLKVEPLIWTFADASLRFGESEEATAYVTKFVESPEGSPAEFEAFRVRRTPEGRDVHDPVFVARYEVSGDSLRVVQALDRRLLPPDVAPWKDAVYYELERVTVGSAERLPVEDEADAPEASPNPGQGSSQEAFVDPAELIGTWRQVRQSLGDDPLAIRAETTWTFDGDSLIEKKTPKDGEPVAYDFRIEHSAEVPGGFTRIKTAPPFQGSRHLLRYQIQGSKLQVKMRDSPEATTFPDQAAPDGHDYYLEFERVADAAVPPELIGTWRLKTHVVASAPDAKVTFTKWTFDETTLGMDTSEQNRENRYEVLSFPDSPGTFRTYRFHEVPAGLAHEGSILRVRYVVEAEGDRLRVAFGGGAGPPETVAPGAGVIYYEFDRVAPEALAATKDAPDDGAATISPPAESAVGP